MTQIQERRSRVVSSTNRTKTRGANGRITQHGRSRANTNTNTRQAESAWDEFLMKGSKHDHGQAAVTSSPVVVECCETFDGLLLGGGGRGKLGCSYRQDIKLAKWHKRCACGNRNDVILTSATMAGREGRELHGMLIAVRAKAIISKYQGCMSRVAIIRHVILYASSG